MELLRSFWHETLGFLNEPMFTLGDSDITLLRILGLLLIFLVARRLSVVVQRGILRLTADQKDDPAVYLLQRISGYLVWLAAALMALNYLGSSFPIWLSSEVRSAWGWASACRTFSTTSSPASLSCSRRRSRWATWSSCNPA